MLNVGIVGIGFMGMTHYNAYNEIDGVQVRAICETDEKRRAGDWTSIKGNFGPQGEVIDVSGMNCYAKAEEIIADAEIDMIDVCLPPSLHADITVKALEAGKHVFCEKPMALAASEAKRMYDAAQAAGKMLLIGHVLPYFPEYAYALEVINSGKYGKVLGGHFKRMISDPAATWLPDFYNPETVGGPMLDLHIHDAHFIRVLFGMPSKVRTVGSMRGECVDRFSTQFLFDDPDLVVTAQSGVIDQQGRPFTHAYEIYLEKATILFDYAAVAGGLDTSIPVTLFEPDGTVTRPEIAGGPVEAFKAELTEVTRAVTEGSTSPLLDGLLARDAMTICACQTESAKTRKAVDIA